MVQVKEELIEVEEDVGFLSSTSGVDDDNPELTHPNNFGQSKSRHSTK
jgi:F420-0:gamma-glutamyl ligase